MTTYVIDASNPLPPTTEKYEHALQTTEGDTVILGDGTHVIDGGEGNDTIQFRRQAFVDLRVSDEQKTPTHHGIPFATSRI